MPQSTPSPRRPRLSRTLLLTAAAALTSVTAAVFAVPKEGDLEKMKPHWKVDSIPPAPVLSPQDELKTFRVPPGFKVELVASEPLTEVPIAAAFDPDGRMYVVELRAYMPNIDAKGELEPLGRISRLEDTDGDGVYDKSTVFMDKLVIPRAISFAAGGLLVSEPPNLYLAQDTDGDGVADKKTVVATDYASRSPNPEHMANGLVWMLDNWCYSANWGFRLKFANGKLVREATPSRGQWGIAQDDDGRLFYNSNSDMLRADLVPAQNVTRNPYVANPTGANFKVAPNGVASARVNTGVNRGYTPVLGTDGKLKTVTAACGPQIYRGDLFGPDVRGDAFVCEPSGNLIARHKLTQTDLTITGQPVRYQDPKLGELDFLTSTDERFRPVSLLNGPDGALYVVDMYHGILQHYAYLTAYLADQIKQRDLDKGNNTRGRIWRIVPENYKRAPLPKLSKATSAELVAALSHANGWVRDTAQRLLVEHADPKSVPLLAKVAQNQDKSATALARVHAIWALEGMGKLEDEVAAVTLKDPEPRVRVQALRAAEMLIRKKTGIDTMAALNTLANDPDLAVQLQLVTLATPENVELQAAANRILAARLGDPVFRSAALSAAAGRELELLKSVSTDKAFAAAPAKAKESLYNDLAECVVKGRSAARIEQLFDLIAATPAAQKADRLAMLHGMTEAVAPDPKSKAPKRKLRLLREPPGLAAIAAGKDKKEADLAAKIDAGLSWPNKPGD
ncbi:MAG TPA: PVC-type heme-binding CxxCH protein, partial [Humisphaera sp.]